MGYAAYPPPTHVSRCYTITAKNLKLAYMLWPDIQVTKNTDRGRLVTLNFGVGL